MNYITKSAAALGLALLSIGPAAALAQQTAPPPDPPPDAVGPASAGTPNPQRFAAMRAAHANLERIRQQARLQMLGALTPQHRTQFGTIVAAFATAATPDAAVTAKQIDAILSAREASAILQTEAAARASERSVMEAQRTAFEATLTADERARIATREQAMNAARAAHPLRERTADAGEVLLHTALGLGRHDGGPHEGFGGGPPGAR